uniref:SFRICE_033100 n=1 Tax=Spodoptera frugiperda TaxID=7108 RepID=A0A2H1W6A5_SPOFR
MLWAVAQRQSRSGKTRDNDSLDRLVVQGKVEGCRPRGRSPMRWTDQVKAMVGDPVHECTRLTTNRERWRDIRYLGQLNGDNKPGGVPPSTPVFVPSGHREQSEGYWDTQPWGLP